MTSPRDTETETETQTICTTNTSMQQPKVSPSRQVLQEWLDTNHVFHDDRLEITEMEDGSGWRVVALEDMDIGEKLCAIPKTSMLSHRTSSLPPLPPSVFEASGAGTSDDVSSTSMNARTILHLTLCLLHEFRLGPRSPFEGYLQSLPRDAIGLPVFWELGEGADGLSSEDGLEARKWLKGSQAEKDLVYREKEGLGLADLRRFHNSTRSHLPPTPTHPEPPSFLSFLHAFSLISTRAFLIDLYHLVALCPFADILNHSSNPHTSLLADDFVCHICGSLKACSHDIFPPSPAHWATGPLTSASSTASTSSKYIGSASAHAMDGGRVPYRLSHLGQRERDRISREADTVEMRAERPVMKGEEVWNSYGDGIGDSRLLVEWGFIAEEFVGEGLTWELDEMGLGIGVEERFDQVSIDLSQASKQNAANAACDKEIQTRDGIGCRGANGSETNERYWEMVNRLQVQLNMQKRHSAGRQDQEEDEEMLFYYPGSMDDGDSDQEDEEGGEDGVVGGEDRSLNLDQNARMSINIFALSWLDEDHRSHSDDEQNQLNGGRDGRESGGGGQAESCVNSKGAPPKEKLEQGKILEMAEAIRGLEALWLELSHGEDEDHNDDNDNDNEHEYDNENEHDHEHDYDNEDTESKLGEDSSSLHDGITLPAVQNLDQRTIRVIRRIWALLKTKLQGMYRPSLSTEELFALRDNLDAKKDKYTYMAMTLSINERILIRSAMDRWAVLLKAVRSGQ